MSNEVIGKQINKLRNKFGLTQEDLAEKLGYSKQTISNWETGLKTPRMGAIQKIADLFHVSKAYIIEGLETDGYDKLLNVYDQLNDTRKSEVVSFAEYKLTEQNNKIISNITNLNKEEIETMAAHSPNRDKKYTKEELDAIRNFADEEIAKYKKKNGLD